MLAGRVADQLVEAAHGGGVESEHGTIVCHTEQQAAAAAVGQGHQLGGQTIGMAGVALELVAAVFAARQELQQFGFGHGVCRTLGPVRLPWLASGAPRSVGGL